MRRASKLTFATAVVLVVGCNLILDNQQGKPFVGDENVVDVHADTPVDVASDAPPLVCDGGVPDDASAALCPGGVWYVSVTTGDDSNSGCSPCAPKASVQSTLDTIKSATIAVDGGASGFEIHACAGTYPEVGLVLDQPVALRGGYDCATWVRPSDFGYPTFNPAVATVLVNGNPPSQDGTLEITDGASGVVEGFSIEGAPVTTNSTTAIHIDGSATVKITSCKLTGGTGIGAFSCAYGSAGIDVRGAASPDITANDIHGGSGVCNNGNGSLGVAALFGSGAPHIHGNKIDGGSGTGSNGSIGILVSTDTGAYTTAANAAIENNVIAGGSGVGNGVGSVGVYVYNDSATFDLVGNTIQGGTGNGVVVGLYATSTYAVNATQNRIAGGGTITVADGGAAPVFSAASSHAIHLFDSTATITNNFIHGGYSSSNTDGIVEQGSVVTLAYNTILSGGSAGVYPAPAIYTLYGAVAIRGNILAGYADAASPAIYEARKCDDGTQDFIVDFTDNAIVNMAAGVSVYTTCVDSSSIAETEGIINLAPNPPTAASGNVTLRSSCSESRCFVEPACTLTSGSDSACLLTVLSGYTASDIGLTELLTTGYLLRSNAHCEITKGADTSSTLVTTDFFGTARTNRFSMGAVEQDSASCVP